MFVLNYHKPHPGIFQWIQTDHHFQNLQHRLQIRLGISIPRDPVVVVAGPPLDSGVGDLELLAVVLHGGLLDQLGNFPKELLAMGCIVVWGAFVTFK